MGKVAKIGKKVYELLANLPYNAGAMKKEPIGKFVERRRKLLRLTQTELASYVGYSPQAFSKFEAGRLSISLLVAPSLANALNLTLDDLFARRENDSQIVNKPLDPEIISVQLQFFRNARGLTQNELAAKTGASVRSLRSYELGDAVPTLTFIDRLLEEFNLESSYILYKNPLMMDTNLAASIRSGQIRTKKKKQLYASLLGIFSCFVAAVGVGVAQISRAGALRLGLNEQVDEASQLYEAQLPVVEPSEDDTSASNETYLLSDIDL